MQDLGRTYCFNCKKPIRRNGRKIHCSVCKEYMHLSYTFLSLTDYKHYNSSNCDWFCQPCSLSTFPFHSLDDKELLKLSYNSNTSCLCSHNITHLKLESLPLLQTTSDITLIATGSIVYLNYKILAAKNLSQFYIAT